MLEKGTVASLVDRQRKTRGNPLSDGQTRKILDLTAQLVGLRPADKLSKEAQAAISDYVNLLAEQTNTEIIPSTDRANPPKTSPDRKMRIAAMKTSIAFLIENSDSLGSFSAPEFAGIFGLEGRAAHVVLIEFRNANTLPEGIHFAPYREQVSRATDTDRETRPPRRRAKSYGEPEVVQPDRPLSLTERMRELRSMLTTARDELTRREKLQQAPGGFDQTDQIRRLTNSIKTMEDELEAKTKQLLDETRKKPDG